jgi:hypothetical protein
MVLLRVAGPSEVQAESSIPVELGKVMTRQSTYSRPIAYPGAIAIPSPPKNYGMHVLQVLEGNNRCLRAA